MYLIVYPQTYLTPIRMATITHTYAQKKKKKKKREKRKKDGKEAGKLQMSNGMAAMENSMVVP